MTLSEIHISNLRNIFSARLSFHPHLNIISGINGSGKTSFLEALYLLSSGHSFRTREVSALVSHQQSSLTVFAKTADYARISIQKSVNLPTIAMLNSEPCLSRSELAAFLPCQVFYQDIFQLIDAGPQVRRGLLDWGLFHVEHTYHGVWKEYRRVLKQRNSLLKQKINASDLVPWNKILAELASQLDLLRDSYFKNLAYEFSVIINQLSDLDCSLSYYRGWDKKNEGKTLEAILQATFHSDYQRQYTHYGAHHADLMIVGPDYKVKQFLSRGQQKIVLFALKFAQAKLVNRACLFLIDDLTAEFDEQHIHRIMDYIKQLKGQFFITTRQSDYSLLQLLPENHKLLAVENGQFM